MFTFGRLNHPSDVLAFQRFIFLLSGLPFDTLIENKLSVSSSDLFLFFLVFSFLFFFFVRCSLYALAGEWMEEGSQLFEQLFFLFFKLLATEIGSLFCLYRTYTHNSQDIKLETFCSYGGFNLDNWFVGFFFFFLFWGKKARLQLMKVKEWMMESVSKRFKGLIDFSNYS